MVVKPRAFCLLCVPTPGTIDGPTVNGPAVIVVRTALGPSAGTGSWHAWFCQRNLPSRIGGPNGALAQAFVASCDVFVIFWAHT